MDNVQRTGMSTLQRVLVRATL